MKIVLIAFLIMSINYSVNAQNFKTSYYLKKEKKVETNLYETDINISPTVITIKNWNNGKTEDLIMKIDKVETKPYDDIICTWYYCTDTKKDFISGTYSKNICIYNKNDNSLIYANFATEVDVYWYRLYFK